MLPQYVARCEETILPLICFIELSNPGKSEAIRQTGRLLTNTSQQKGREMVGFKTLSTYDLIMVAIAFIVHLKAER
ncbi:MAG: hypothetical protein ACR2IS_08850 [Nitrososphaeraceae archaeon]